MKQKYRASLLVLLVSNFLLCQEVILQFKNGQTKQGEFIGTYMSHVHLLMGEDLLYFPCKDINKVLKIRPNQKFESFSYNCSENTVTVDILFPPFLNPMTGEWETNIPDVFNSEIQLSQFEESKKQSEGEISEFKIKELVRSAVKKEISKEREITNSYIQANQNKISKLELEIKNLKSREANKNNSNSSFSSPRNHWELLTIGCIGYLAVLVISSF